MLLPARPSPPHPPSAEPGDEHSADVLVWLASPEEPEARVRLEKCLQRLPREVSWKLLAGEKPADDFSDYREVRVIVCELALWPEARQRGVAVILLVSPGEEEQAAEFLQKVPALVLLKGGRYERLLPALITQTVEAQRYREEFGHYLRHEINNPLTGILVNAELLLDSAEGFSAASRKRLQTIIGQCIGLRKLIQTIEEKIPAGGLPGPPAEVRQNDTELP